MNGEASTMTTGNTIAAASSHTAAQRGTVTSSDDSSTTGSKVIAHIAHNRRRRRGAPHSARLPKQEKKQQRPNGQQRGRDRVGVVCEGREIEERKERAQPRPDHSLLRKRLSCRHPETSDSYCDHGRP